MIHVYIFIYEFVLQKYIGIIVTIIMIIITIIIIIIIIIIMDNQSRLMLNDQKINLGNEPQRSPEFVQKQPREVFSKGRCS